MVLHGMYCTISSIRLPKMPAFRQVGEKQLPNSILFMVWSPKRDLIALANKAGELLLHRLASFQRVWSLAPNEDTGKEITSLAWRPDGKIIAFSLADTKQVILCDVEKAEILHFFPVESLVSCMHWMEVSEESSTLTSFCNAEDETSHFLPKLPALPKSYSATSKIFSEEKSDEVMKLLGDVRLNILVLGGGSGFTELYAYGMYKIATLAGVAGTCRSLCLSSDLKSLSVITEIKSTENEPEITYFQLDTSLLSDCLPEVTRMARKFTHISTLLQYQKLSLTCMCEAWEDILMQMDLRLTKFVQEKNTTTSVQDEFIQLLLWGKASPELQALLMNQLTVKGLKKLGQSIESSYSSIQKLVISHLQSGSEALLYYLSELKGMALWKQKYEPLGLDAALIEDAITAVGSFILKANELLQVIDSSMKNFKAFFRWLYVAMLRMSEDHVLPELNKMTQKDIAFVADFLTEHFNEAPELYDRKGKYFNVERVGQYLKDEDDDLVSPPNSKGNQWVNFHQNSTPLKESPLLFPYYPQKSLYYVKRIMEGVIDLCLQKPAEIIGKSIKQAIGMPLYTIPTSTDTLPRLFELPSLWNDKKSGMHYIVFTMPEISPCKLYIMRKATDLSRSVSSGLVAIDLGSLLSRSIDGTAEASRYSCLDARFFDDETLTVVLKEAVEEEHRGRILAQLPLSPVYAGEEEFILDPSMKLDQQSGDIPVQSVVLENQWRTLENMKAQYVAVNGIRKVSCVLSSNLRHIRVFEMDVEDEEEEDKQDVSGDQEKLEQSLEPSLCSQEDTEEGELTEGAEAGTSDLQEENASTSEI
ncbi:anaphase-promoting complex subunit 4 isoform X1 [Acipenser ruthenus]|uniref:anaphase-promoting complex subunit 4 isoform X1 n=2 Tax=Acipenser ruthenus TaxID=7906 RepID=UPI002740E233|nr:anaphase-promoting complex subunit 4 isoform X1 [Acipenser ruthenus]